MKFPLLNRVKKEKREHLDLEGEGLFNSLFRPRSAKSGVDVNDVTALQTTAVWACIRVLSYTLASLPLHVYKRLEPRGKERAQEHQVYKILHDFPNPLQTSFNFRSTAMVHLCQQGNAYAEIEYDRGGNVVALWQIPPWRVRPKITENKALIYEVELNKQPKILPDWKIVHIKGLSVNGLTGLGIIEHAREAIGLALAAEEFGARYFGDGTNIGGTASHPGELSDKAYKRLKQSLNEQYQGLGKSHRLMLLEEGMKFENLTISPDQSQFLQTRKFQVAEIARMFGVPLHKIGELERSTFSNIEHQAIEFVVDTMRPWLVNWEQELNRKLFNNTEYFAEFLVDGLLRGDTQARYQAYMTGRNWGWLSANDVRELENMNPIEDGDVYLVPLNMQPAEWLKDPPLPTMPESNKAEPAEQRSTAQTRFRIARSYRKVFEDAGKRIIERESQNIKRYVKKHLGERSVQLFIDQIEEFYRDFPTYIKRNLLPSVTALAEAIEPLVKEQLKRDSTANIQKFIQDYLEAYTIRHINSSRGQIEALLEEEDPEGAIETRLTEWEQRRPSKIAMNETVQFSNAVALTLFAGAGVVSLVWRNASGDPCPFCSELDGKVVGIEQDFVGETVFAEGERPMKIRRPAMQPPLHEGCQCVIDPQ